MFSYFCWMDTVTSVSLLSAQLTIVLGELRECVQLNNLLGANPISISPIKNNSTTNNHLII